MRFAQNVFLLLLLCVSLSCEIEAQRYNASGSPIAIQAEDNSPEWTAVNSLFTAGNALTSPEQVALKRFVDSQVRSGNWRRIHVLQLGRRLSSEAKCLIDIKGVVNGTGTGTWDVATGIQTNGTSNFWATGFIETTHAVNVGGSSTLNNIGIAVELTSNDHGTSAGTIFGVVGSVSARQIRYDQSSGGVNRTWKVHTSSTVTEALGVFESNTFHTLYRSLADRQGTEENWDGVSTNTTSSSNIPDRQLYLGALNNNGTASAFMAGKFGTFIAFDYVNFDYANFYINWQYLMQELGDTKDTLYPYDFPEPDRYTVADGIIINMEGQSNSSGRATGRSAKFTYQMPNTLVFWRNPPIMATTLLVQNLQFGSNHTYETLSESGTELAACRTLQDRVYARIILSKYAVSGTSLKPGVTDPDWSVSANELTNVSDNLILNDGIDALAGAYALKKIFFNWNQGEADRNGTTQSEYATELTAKIKYKIDQLEANGVNFTNTEFHILIRRMPDVLGGTTLSQIQAAEDAAQSHFESAHPTYASKITSWTIYRTTDNLSYPDGVHLSSRAYEMQGIKEGLFYWRR